MIHGKLNFHYCIIPGVDRAPGGSERGSVHGGCEDIRQHIAAGPVVHRHTRAHQETDQRQPRPALNSKQTKTYLPPCKFVN